MTHSPRATPLAVCRYVGAVMSSTDLSSFGVNLEGGKTLDQVRFGFKPDHIKDRPASLAASASRKR